jgi:FtsH-binding integral membrane protein
MRKNSVSKAVKRLLTSIFILALSQASCAQSTGYSSQIQKPIKDLLCAIWDALIYIGIAAGGLVIVVAGVNYVLNRDNPAQRKASISWVIHVVIGLIVLSLAKIIVESTKVPVNCNIV